MRVSRILFGLAGLCLAALVFGQTVHYGSLQAEGFEVGNKMSVGNTTFAWGGLGISDSQNLNPGSFNLWPAGGASNLFISGQSLQDYVLMVVSNAIGTNIPPVGPDGDYTPGSYDGVTGVKHVYRVDDLPDTKWVDMASDLSGAHTVFASDGAGLWSGTIESGSTNVQYAQAQQSFDETSWRSVDISDDGSVAVALPTSGRAVVRTNASAYFSPTGIEDGGGSTNWRKCAITGNGSNAVFITDTEDRVFNRSANTITTTSNRYYYNTNGLYLGGAVVPPEYGYVSKKQQNSLLLSQDPRGRVLFLNNNGQLNTTVYDPENCSKLDYSADLAVNFGLGEAWRTNDHRRIVFTDFEEFNDNRGWITNYSKTYSNVLQTTNSCTILCSGVVRSYFNSNSVYVTHPSVGYFDSNKLSFCTYDDERTYNDCVWWDDYHQKWVTNYDSATISYTRRWYASKKPYNSCSYTLTNYAGDITTYLYPCDSGIDSAAAFISFSASNYSGLTSNYIYGCNSQTDSITTVIYWTQQSELINGNWIYVWKTQGGPTLPSGCENLYYTTSTPTNFSYSGVFRKHGNTYSISNCSDFAVLYDSSKSEGIDYLVAGSSNGYIYINSGEGYVAQEDPGTNNWKQILCSTNGHNVIAIGSETKTVSIDDVATPVNAWHYDPKTAIPTWKPIPAVMLGTNGTHYFLKWDKAYIAGSRCYMIPEHTGVTDSHLWTFDLSGY